MTWEGTGGAHGPERDPFEILAPLAAAATVRIHSLSAGYDGDEHHGEAGSRGARLWGSGFQVAPGWVLTCAHVALRGGMAEGGRREVALSFRDSDRPVRGVVEWAQPWEHRTAGRWPPPDLALVRVLEPAPRDCVWLTERTQAFFTSGEVAFLGHAEIDGCVEPISGRCTISGDVGTSGELKITSQDEIPPGTSGGPLVDLTSGEVIGVVKGRRTGGRDGGLGVSALQLRRLPQPPAPLREERDDLYHRVTHAHDRYHRDRHLDAGAPDDTWTDVQTVLPGPARRRLTPGQRVELLGLLAELPPPASVQTLNRMITELRGRPFQGALPAPRGWRDGLGLLYDLGPGRSEAETVLRYAVHAATALHPFAARSGTEDQLLEWAHRTAADLVLPHYVRSMLYEEQHSRDIARRAGADRREAVAAGRAGSAGPALSPVDDPAPDATAPAGTQPFVLLSITEHAWDPQHFDWEVYAPLPDGELAVVDADTDAEEYDPPPARLRAALQEAIRRCDEAGRPVMVQAALPYERIGLPVDGWQVSEEGGAASPCLGEERPVVVRCVDHPPAHEDELLASQRQIRWKRLHLDSMNPVVLDCLGGHRRPLADASTLSVQPEDTVPVLCRSGAGGDGGGDPFALSQVLTGGFDVVLWRRGPHTHEPGCGDLHRGVVATVAAAGRGGELPDALWRLRADVGNGVPEAYWSAGLALHYAHPGHVLPGADEPLEAP
ncbi:VMAP-C domain-containing protein [Streptomyces sp. 4N509B]|uniref:VMAP-C domain-containing protein n=1 Tax=Streptomyces sp. 4N509B TaxID=3457413 RepID=UPI003FD4B190